MIRFILPALAAASFALPAAAATLVPVPGLVNSGMNAAATAVSVGTVTDAHWTLAGGTAWNSASLNGNWLANTAVSRWLTPASNGNQSYDPSADGFYTYTLSFDLSGYNPATGSFAGRFAADNSVTGITLNGQAISQSGPGNFNAWTNFDSTGGSFVAGLNTLSFTVRNFAQSSGNPTGLRVEFLNSAIAAVPEPATWAMLIAGFGMVGAASRRRRKVAHVSA